MKILPLTPITRPFPIPPHLPFSLMSTYHYVVNQSQLPGSTRGSLTKVRVVSPSLLHATTTRTTSRHSLTEMIHISVTLPSLIPQDLDSEPAQN